MTTPSSDFALPLCESPLEREFGTALVELLARWLSPPLRERDRDEWPELIGMMPHWGATLFHQPDIGWCRPDFMLQSMGGAYFPAPAGYAKAAIGNENVVVIEVDGHDYHERTKEQARRDRSRDRQMMMHGWVPLRFTGSEIYRDASACAVEAWVIFETRQHRVLEQIYGISRPWTPGVQG